MTDIYKKFFDTFGINPKYTYLITDTFYTNNSHTYTATKDDLIDYFEGKNCGRYKVIKVYKNYPPFTDTKQLNLIKYFSENIDFLELSHNGEEFEFYSSGSRDGNKDFSQALASFIYYKWEDLTDVQREEVRGILQ